MLEVVKVRGVGRIGCAGMFVLIWILRELFSFKGTASRFEWWMISLVSDLLVQVGIVSSMFYFSGSRVRDVALGIGISALTLLCLWVAIAVIVRRLRDRGRPWQMALLALIPYIGWIWLVVECGFLKAPSQRGKKRVVRRTIKS